LETGSKNKMTTLKEALETQLTEEEKKHFTRAFDVLGTIAIIEIREELLKKEKLIAETILKLNKNLKTVCKKVGGHKGIYRRQKLKILAGEKNKITTYKENNVTLKFNAETSYFSPRLSTERKRITELIQPGEKILVMFSGVAPYPLIISKNTKAKEVYGVEINPEAHKFAEQNLKLNKIKNIKLYLGDVRKVVPKLKKKFNRILMPLPKSAEEFLDVALKASKKGTTVHFYDFLNEEELDKAKEKIEKACKQAKKKYEIIRTVKCGQQAPRTYRTCVDFKLLN